MSGKSSDVSFKSHPVYNGHEMSHIYIDSICIEYLVHFLENGCSGCFYSVYLSDCKDIVTFYGCMVHGCDVFDVVQVNPVRIDGKLISFNSDGYVGYVFGSFDCCF